jgi:phage-related protein
VTAPSGGAAAVWVDVLPNMSNFGAELLRQLRGEGENAGERLGNEIGAGAESGFRRNIGKIVAVGAAVGAALGAGLVKSMNIEAANDKLTAQLGLSAKGAERYGRVGGNLYKGAWGDSLETVNEALRAVTHNIGGTATASDADLQRITASVLDVSTAFDQDLGGTTAAVGQLMRTGLAPNAEAALDIITVGFQNGVDKSGDFLDTINEYGTQFRKLGLDGATATGILSQGLQAGARDADVVADAIKEFSIRAIDGSKLTGEGFQALGLDGAEMARKIAAGGPEASGALDLVLDRLRAMPDPVERSQAAVALFGTQAEDLGDALFALDPSAAVGALGEVGGAAQRMGDTLNNNAATNLESFKRQMMSAFVETVGGYALPAVTGLAALLATGFGPALAVVGGILTGQVIPAVSSFVEFVDRNRVVIGIVAGLVAAVFIPHLIALGVTATVTGIKTAAAWVVTQAGAIRAAAVHSGAVIAMVAQWLVLAPAAARHAATVAASWLLVGGINVAAAVAATVVAVAQMIGHWVVLGAQSLVHAAKVVASWVVTSAGAVAAAAVMVAQVAVQVAQWVFLGVQSLVQAAKVAAAWVLAMGPVGWVIATVVALVALIIANWDKVKAATIAAWNAISGAVTTAWEWIKQAFSTSVAFVRNLWDTFWAALRQVASTVWNAILSVVTTVWDAIKAGFDTAVAFVTGLWDRFWTGLARVASTVFGAIKTTIDTVTAGIGGAFEWVVDKVGRIWGGLRALLAKPINFLINTVYNGGIVKAWNFVADLLPGIGPIGKIAPIPEYAKGGPVASDTILRAGEAGEEYVLSNPAVRAMGGLDAVDRWHRDLIASHPQDTLRALNAGRIIEGADHNGPGSRTSGFGGVQPHVAQAGWYLKQRFGIGGVGGVGSRPNKSDHPKGLALDFMTSGNNGTALANEVIANRAHYAATYAIWRQKINSGSGWRGMPDRGSPTANHMDHVHVSFASGPGGVTGEGDTGGGFFDLRGWIREQLESITNPLIDQLRRTFPAPPRFMETAPAAAALIRDKVLDFLLGSAYDSGGVASGRGLMFKDTIDPERVLSPRQTVAFEQLVAQLGAAPVAPVLPASAEQHTGGGGDMGELLQVQRDLAALLRKQRPITVEDRSGNPGETARATALALRLAR